MRDLSLSHLLNSRRRGAIFIAATALPLISTAVIAAPVISRTVLPLKSSAPGPHASDKKEAPISGISLHIGQTRVFKDGLKIKFVSVAGDSRCPVDVNCVWAGNAKVSLSVRSKGKKATTLELNTNLQPRAAVYGRYEIQLVGLAPETKSNKAIPRNAYVATLQVAPAGTGGSNVS